MRHLPPPLSGGFRPCQSMPGLTGLSRCGLVELMVYV